MPQRAVDVATGSPTANLYAWAVSLIAAVFGVGNIILGLIVATMPGRLNGASFAYILHIASPTVWGAAFILAGVVAVYAQWTHRRRPARLAHITSAFGCAYWVVAFAVAGVSNPATSVTGCLAYGVMAATHAIIAVVSPHRP